MLRRTLLKRFAGTLLNSSDFATQYPRMNLSTHLVDAGLPELKDCRSLYQASTDAHRSSKCFSLLNRAADVFANVPGWESNEQLGNVVRSIAAAKIQVALQQRGGLLGPIGSVMRSGDNVGAVDTSFPKLQMSRFILRESSEALKAAKWTITDVNQIDIGSFLVGSLVESFARLYPRRDPGSVDRDRLVTVEQKPLLQFAMDHVTQLIRLADIAASTHGASHPSLKYVPVKLTVLKAIITVALDGNLATAQSLIMSAAGIVEEWGQKRHLLGDVNQDPILGILMLLNAEISARIFNWTGYQRNESVDNDVLLKFQQACEFYSGRFASPTEVDGIMNPKAESISTYTKGQTASEDLILRDHYSTCLLSFGNFLLSAPRSNPKETIFAKGEAFCRNAITTIASGTDMMFDDCRVPTLLKVQTARKQAEVAFDRALKINRMLLPDNKHNEKAGWMLMSMACCFGDLRDYLYATGLMSNATNTFREVYGELSEEHMFLLKLEERLLNGMGSAKEAETRRNRIAALSEERSTFKC